MPKELKQALRKQFHHTGAGAYWQTVTKYASQIRTITELLLRLLPNHRGLKHVRGRRTGDRLDLRVAAQFEADRRLHDKLWIKRVHRPLPEPVFVFAMDCSSSMERDGRSTAAYESIVVMREACKRAAIPFSALGFNDDVEVLLGWEHPDDTKSQLVLSSLLRPNGGTEVASALEAAEQLLEERSERDRFVFLMTDGEATPSDARDVRACNARLAQNGVEVLAFGLGAGAKNIFNVCADAELVPDAGALPGAFSRALIRAINGAL
jgi:nitric oxide reductase activation protein